MFRLLVILGLCLFMEACTSFESSQNMMTLPTQGENGINAVIEIPAGTNHKIEYNKDKKSFENDEINGETRMIDFLPYPGNYGFIPSTLMDVGQGGDGDALDILVLGESLPTKSLIATRPIATLLLRDQGEIDTKIIAVPADPAFQIMEISNFQDFLIRYDAAKRIIESWFLNYKGSNTIELIRWEDETYALKEIERWKIK